jgi:hypothetical protein
MHFPLRRVGGVLLLLALLRPTDARAAERYGVGGGPVFAFSWHGGTYLGWELAGVRGADVFAHLTLGGSYRVWQSPEALESSPRRDPTYFHYVAWEPWVYLGATLGAAVTDQLQPRVVYGLWEGLPLSIDGDFLGSDELQWVFSFAFGWRGIGGTHQFYLTPKLWRMHGVDLFD